MLVSNTTIYAASLGTAAGYHFHSGNALSPGGLRSGQQKFSGAIGRPMPYVGAFVPPMDGGSFSALGEVSSANGHAEPIVWALPRVRGAGSASGQSRFNIARLVRAAGLVVASGLARFKSWASLKAFGQIGASPSPAEVAYSVMDGIEIEPNVSLRQAMRAMMAVILGRLSGAGTGTETFKAGVSDHKDRVISTTDSSGNRTGVTVDTSP